MSALLRDPARVPSLFSRSVDDDYAPSHPAGRWRVALRALAAPSLPAGVATAGAALAATLVDVPIVQAATRIAASMLAG